jgi:hypothetical protein
MCWNKETSIASFIVGTLINIAVMLYFNNTLFYVFGIIWQWVLMMQLSEYLIWTEQNGGSINNFGTKSALIFNLTQPIIFFLVLMCVAKVPVHFKILASIIILFYICYMFIQLNKASEYKKTNPLDNCSNLNLKWWKDMDYSGIIYCITLIAITLLLLRPFSIAVFSLVLIFILFGISQFIYSCGTASVWCWLVVPFPIFLGLYYKYFVENSS